MFHRCLPEFHVNCSLLNSFDIIKIKILKLRFFVYSNLLVFLCFNFNLFLFLNISWYISIDRSNINTFKQWLVNWNVHSKWNMDSILSKQYVINAGVPQVGVLKPLLHLISTFRDIPHVNKVDIAIFAVDTAIFAVDIALTCSAAEA